MTKVSIVGLGYVGLPLALLASKKGFNVTGIDLDASKVELVNKHINAINDEYVEKHIKNTNLKAENNFDSIQESKTVIVCVPTPVKNGYQPDLEPLKGAVIPECAMSLLFH
jgi:UDP-N-acetyl-D-glucosamine dehydrogenase